MAVEILPAWTDQALIVPRAAVFAVGHPPGTITLLDEDFTNGLQGWKVKGDPARQVAPAGGTISLVLDQPRQAVEYVLPGPVDAGRIALSYRAEVPLPAGARWFVDVTLVRDDRPMPVTIELAHQGTTIIRAAPGLEATTAPSFALTGWHRLEVELAHGQLLVQVDHQELHRTKASPGLRLHKLRVRCADGPVPPLLGGEVWVKDIRITRLVDELPRPPGEPDQDDVWLAAGDQLFGNIVAADERSIDLQCRLGPRTLAWSDVRAVNLRRQAGPPRVATGEHVRVWIDVGDGWTPDQLEGVVTGLNDQHLVLTHPYLGRVQVERAAVRQILWRFQGRRIELDRGMHHLGERPIGQSILRPEGTSLRRTFAVPAVPASARLYVTVAHLPAPGDDATVARMLQRGGLRTEVVLNGRVVDYLNHYLARTPAEPATVSLALPPANLRAGNNVLELRQTADAETGRSANCVVSAIIIEIPE
jgi:hypothetical protein